jgi:hypothetical protein
MHCKRMQPKLGLDTASDESVLQEVTVRASHVCPANGGIPELQFDRGSRLKLTQCKIPDRPPFYFEQSMQVG